MALMFGRRLPAAGTIRLSLVLAGIVLLASVCLFPALRSFCLDHGLLSALIFVVAGAILLPSRWWFLAPVFGAAAYAAATMAMHLKERAVGLPITWIDLQYAFAEPAVVAGAVGYHGALAPFAAVASLILAVVVVLTARKFGAAGARQVGLRAVELAALLALSLVALCYAGRDLSATAATRYPDVALQLWEPWGQRLLMRRVGPLEYVAFTYATGQRGALEEETDGPPISAAQVQGAAADYISGAPSGPLPNIAIIHAESSFDPNIIFRLTKRVDLPLWTRNTDTILLGPLRVNVIGGGTQVTQFELFTGLDSRQFGYLGFYTHLTIAPRVRRAFPSVLQGKGYRTIASYPVDPVWLGAGSAFRAYGFERTFFSHELSLRGDWSESDPVLIDRVIGKGVFRPSARPLLIYLSTLENHGPHPCVHFHTQAELRTTLQGDATFAQNCSINEYIRRARSTSAAMLSVLAQLKQLEAATGRPFVLLVYGDHQPWSFTDGDYSVAGGVANAHDMSSYARFRRGNNQQITFYHVMTSVRGLQFGELHQPVPASLLPTLLSAFLRREADELYLPVNLLAFQQCGSDLRSAACKVRPSVERQARRQVFGG